MRKTLALADNVLAAAKAIASAQNRTIGNVVSDLARRSLQRPAGAESSRNGIPLLPLQASDVVVGLQIVKELRDETP